MAHRPSEKGCVLKLKVRGFFLPSERVVAKLLILLVLLVLVACQSPPDRHDMDPVATFWEQVHRALEPLLPRLHGLEPYPVIEADPVSVLPAGDGPLGRR